MSWSDIYPLLTDEMIDSYRAQVTGEEREEMENWFGVRSVLGARESSHLVVVSLSKRPYPACSDPKAVDPLKMDGDAWQGWYQYQQLLAGADAIKKYKKQVVVRVYLAADLSDLVSLLTLAGCEVFLMKGSACLACQASMWRFLALEDEGKWITISHASMGEQMIHDVERTEELMATRLGFWRVPHLVGDESQKNQARSYRPIQAGHFGAKGGVAAGSMMRALIWHCRRGSIAKGCIEDSGQQGYPLDGSHWPSEAFPEWFLLVAIYPRVAFQGVLTLLIWQQKMITSHYAMDVEYVTWANPDSEVILSKKIVLPEAHWNRLPLSSGVAVRPDTRVVCRQRRRVYGEIKPSELAPQLHEFSKFTGSLMSLLAWASSNLSEKWWVDLNHSLKPHPFGAEIFVDRIYENADVVVSGYFFSKITEDDCKWASGFAEDAEFWQTGEVRKVPKLEGPLTLWRTAFGKLFAQSIASPKNPRPELVLAYWIKCGQAKVMSASARKMGWLAH